MEQKIKDLINYEVVFEKTGRLDRLSADRYDTEKGKKDINKIRYDEEDLTTDFKEMKKS